MRKRGSRLLLLTCVGLLCAGCGSDSAERELADSLLDLEEPLLAPLDPMVREQLEAMRAQVNELRDDRHAARGALGGAYADLGRRYHTYQFFSAAVPCYINAEILLPDDYRWPYYLGHAYASLDRLGDAREAFSRALALKPDDVPARIALGRTHLAEGNLDAAWSVGLEAVEADPESAGAILMLAQVSVERGESAAAVERYERLLELQPGATRMYKPLAMAYRDAGRTEDARRAMASIGDGSIRVRDPLMRELRPLATGAMQIREAGLAAFKRGEFEEAAKQFRLAIEADPDYDGDRLNLGSALAQMGRYEEAAELMREVIAMKSDHVLAHYNLGVTLDALGRREEAIEVYRQTLLLDDASMRPRFNLATALREAGRCDEALEHYARLVRDYPGDRSIRVGDALCLVQQERFDEATARLEEALRTSPGDAWLTRITARLLAASPEDGLRDGTRALEHAVVLVEKERSPVNLETLAMALAEVGRLSEAATTQQDALAAAESAGRRDLLPRLRENLALYRSGKPARDPAL